MENPYKLTRSKNGHKYRVTRINSDRNYTVTNVMLTSSEEMLGSLRSIANGHYPANRDQVTISVEKAPRGYTWTHKEDQK